MKIRRHTLFNPLSPWIYIYNTRLLVQAGTEAERMAGWGPAPGKKKKIPCLPLEYVNNSCSQGQSNPSFHFSNMHSSCYHRLYSVQNTSCVHTRLLPPTIHKKPFSVTEPVFFSLKKKFFKPFMSITPPPWFITVDEWQQRMHRNYLVFAYEWIHRETRTILYRCFYLLLEGK
jgi:hypothetical protein